MKFKLNIIKSFLFFLPLFYILESSASLAQNSASLSDVGPTAIRLELVNAILDFKSKIQVFNFDLRWDVRVISF